VPNSDSRGNTLKSRRATSLGSLGLTVVLAFLLCAGVTAQQTTEKQPIKVILTVDGEKRELLTQAPTVSEMLTEHKIILEELDRCTVPLKSPISEGMDLAISRIRSEVVTERTPIPFANKEVFSSEHRVGTKVVKIPGKLGEKAITYRDYYKDGERTERVKLDATYTKPSPQLTIVGTRGMTLSSRGHFGGRRVMELVATGYGPSGNGRWGMQTATGVRPRYGIVAVDPRVIRLGTRLYVEGYGYAWAMDTGGAIKGNRIDLFYPSDRDASRVGRKKVRVIVLSHSRVSR
jgi:3D (Asp-Asp-Asp) domain-containing protein